MRDLRELDIKQGGEPGRRLPPSDEQIDAFEREFGVALPVDLVTLLKHANGGYPQLDCAPGGHHAIRNFFYLGESEDDWRSIWSEVGEWRLHWVGPRAMIPFADDPFGNLFVVDTARSPSPVLLAVHDNPGELEPVAPSFAAFIDGLVRVDEEARDDFCHPAAPADLLAELRTLPGAPLPDAYLDWIAVEHVGQLWLDGWPIKFWRPQDLLAFNRAYLSRHKPPALFLFAAGAGQYLWGFDARLPGSRPVVEIPVDDLPWERAEMSAPDFGAFMSRLQSRSEMGSELESLCWPECLKQPRREARKRD